VALLVMSLLLGSCGGQRATTGDGRAPLLVAAASNLSGVAEELAAGFTASTGTRVSLVYGATAQHAQQIEHGAPYDLFLSADAAHVDKLVETGHLLRGSRAVYARGKLALWVPPGSRAEINSVRDLRSPAVHFIAIANPETAPYGAAAEALLRAEGLWDELQPRLVRAENVTAAKQMAATGKAEAVFTAYSLVFREKGKLVELPAAETPLIDQALGIPTRSARADEARKFAAYILRGPGREALRAAGYEEP
jgi:molybdate transport system substrate-binding protein